MSNWLTYSPVSGHGNATITLSASTLTGLEDRIATLIATGSQEGQTLSATTVITQKYLTLTEIYFKNLTWVTDVAWSGGTATKDNCTYTIFAKYSDGSEEDITNKATISGSLVVSATTATARQSVGTLTLTATYEGKTCTGNVTAYQEAPSLSEIFFNNLEWVTDIPASGGIADKNNCSYSVYAKYSNNVQVDVTSEANVSGSLQVSPNYVIERHSAGTLTLSAEYINEYGQTFTCTGDVIAYQELQQQEISATTFNTIKWVTNVPASGGTATKDNCTYQIDLILNNGVVISDITSLCTVSGSIVVEPHYELQPNQDGLLTLQGEYRGFTCNGSVNAYRDALTINDIVNIDLSGLTWNGSDINCTGGTVDYTNCDYYVNLNIVDGSIINITDIANVSGSTWIPFSNIMSRHTGGTLTVTAEFSGFTDSDSVEIWQEAYDYYKDWLTIENTGNTTSYGNPQGHVSPTNRTIFQYSTDSGRTWSNFPHNSRLTINSGTCVKVRGPEDDTHFFIMRGLENCIVYGNVMSLVNPFDYRDAKDCYGLSNLFLNSKITRAENLILQATGLTSNCYSGMFDNCSELTTTPELPATTLAEGCYADMFRNCTSLVVPPELPATTLGYSCYSSMFAGCTSLSSAPMLPVTTLTGECYRRMFENCTSLTTPPELPSENLADFCYFGMFSACTSLSSAPVLPSTSLTDACYGSMFAGCTSLTTAPELPATTLVENCYNSMFGGCSSLNYIKCLATDISATNCTRDWVNGVSSTGTFVKPSSMNNWPTGSDGIPIGWTVTNAS